jgi:hypothetical protein
MKYLLIISMFVSFSALQSQNQFSENLITNETHFKKTGNSTENCLSPLQRLQIEIEINKNRQRFIKEGILSPFYSSKAILFDFPLKAKEGFNDPGYYTISSYIDHDPDYPDHLKDFNCGELTYDTEDGYNHQGTDFLLWPFPWYKMDNEQVEVVAAAPGIILYKQDGNFDRNCDGEDLPWNAIFIQHSNGYVTWYGHLKDGSLTEKFVGEEIEAGEYLGVVGSSGISLQPHLHFEVHDENDNIIDPYLGPCNPTADESFWLEQRPYLDAGINKITTNSTLAVFPDCPQQETLNESSTFSGNDTIFLLLYFRNLSAGDNVNITITRPDNSIHSQWVWESPLPFYVASWNYWFLLLKNEQDGNWKFEANYNNETYTHEFQYTNAQSIKENKIQKLSVSPNPVSDKVRISVPVNLSGNFHFQITNITGQKIELIPELNEDKKSFLLNCENLVNGVYIITIENDGTHYQGRFIKR